MSGDAPVSNQTPGTSVTNPYEQAVPAPNPYAPASYAPAYAQGVPTTAGGSGGVLSIVGAVFGVLAVVVLPILFGPAGIVRGFLGNDKGDRPLGLVVGIGSIVTTVLGMVLGILVATPM